MGSVNSTWESQKLKFKLHFLKIIKNNKIQEERLKREFWLRGLKFNHAALFWKKIHLISSDKYQFRRLLIMLMSLNQCYKKVLNTEQLSWVERISLPLRDLWEKIAAVPLLYSIVNLNMAIKGINFKKNGERQRNPVVRPADLSTFLKVSETQYLLLQSFLRVFPFFSGWCKRVLGTRNLLEKTDVS